MHKKLLLIMSMFFLISGGSPKELVPVTEANHTVVPTIELFSDSNAYKNPDGPTITKRFELSTPLKLQSIAYLNHAFYAGFDSPNDQIIVYKYDEEGEELGHTQTLPIIHGASISADSANHHLYITNGGGMNPTQVYEVQFPQKQIIKRLNLSKLGHSGLSTVDVAHSRLWIETSPNDHGRQTFTYCDFNGHVLEQFTIPNQGVPQGLDFSHNRIYLYTNNRITVMSTDGKILRHLKINEPGESEGMVILPSGDILVGYSVKKAQGHYLNQIYEIKGFR
ncbi:hypothetical protein PU629_12420 [Pullulanibacillus sp. KACC 23026]|uniref:hypothetical protein n=1 Tax=Pullulanibacillus sp. KACC 23026 TaxID=3028315 RepID=UPI0023B0504F|nr:hypothetical protein [Pullulanibacillus sp. KACC 23026]WEG10981.1 hypothetical protein PU629_12420 [Pullulanibacillus sp. KACC 23026]